MKSMLKTEKNQWIIFALSLVTIILSSCKSEEEEASTLDTNASIEMPVQVNHISSDKDELVITYTIWKNNMAVGTKVIRDTIPSLGMQSQEAENKDGDVITVQVPAEYKMYITLKPGNPLPENKY